MPTVCGHCVTATSATCRNTVALFGRAICEPMRTESIGTSFLVLPDGTGPHPGVIVIHELFGLNENMRDICKRFAEQGYAALAVDLFAGRNRAVCMARMFSGWLAGDLNYFGVSALKAALDQLAGFPDVDADRIGAIGFCMGGTYALTWACTDNRLTAIAPFYGSAPRRKEALRRLCPVVGSWPDKDLTSAAAATLETELTVAGIAHDLKVYAGARHSFFNDRGANYDPAAATDAWQRVLTFFSEHIAAQRPVPGSQ
jgi:carboxymethylenebutenolidase